jgi:hypothetical protein
MTIAKTIVIEELLELFPDSLNFLADKGIRCVICGEPIWGTLEEAAKEKGFTDQDIDRLAEEINSLYLASSARAKTEG